MKYLAYWIIFFLPSYTTTSDLTLYKNSRGKPTSTFLYKTSKSKKFKQVDRKKSKKKEYFSDFIASTITRDVIKKSAEAILAGCMTEYCIQSITQQSAEYPLFPYAFAIPHALCLVRLAARTVQILNPIYLG